MNQPRTFVLGDIHGAHKALLQCLKKSEFDYQHDHLICLGDVVDGWPETKECIEELLEIKHLSYLMGNHDWWALRWMEGDSPDESWLLHGGSETIRSYGEKPILAHRDFLRNSLPYLILRNKLFVHAGYNPNKPLEEQDEKTFFWDRELAKSAIDASLGKKEIKLTKFDEVFIGHTPISRLGYLHPLKASDIWLMDTGAGWSGVLSIMNIESKEFFTSDSVSQLYPGFPGRNQI